MGCSLAMVSECVGVCEILDNSGPSFQCISPGDHVYSSHDHVYATSCSCLFQIMPATPGLDQVTPTWSRHHCDVIGGDHVYSGDLVHAAFFRVDSA